jgi:hypothetical protein
VVKICSRFPAVLLLNSERVQDGCDGPEDDFIGLDVIQPLLFGQHFADHALDVLLLHFGIPIPDRYSPLAVVPLMVDCTAVLQFDGPPAVTNSRYFWKIRIGPG